LEGKSRELLEQMSRINAEVEKSTVIEHVVVDKNMLSQASRAASLETANRQLQREIESYKVTIQNNRVLEEKIAGLEARLMRQRELQAKCSQLELELEQTKGKGGQHVDLLAQAQHALDLAQTRERIGELQAKIQALNADNTALKEDVDRLGKELMTLRQEHEQALDLWRVSEVHSQTQSNEIVNLRSQVESLVHNPL
jgi:predicted RNase H-like nuclease (RuvC/YqgF family)